MKIRTNVRAGIVASPRCGGRCGGAVATRCGGAGRCGGSTDYIY